MVVTKILEGTLVSGNTTLTFTDSDIPNSLIRVYSTNADVYPASLSVSGTTLTITYEAQSSTLYVAVELVKEGLEVIDDVITDDATKALSAKQGLYLKGLIDNLGAPSIAELSDVTISSPADGDVLVYSDGVWVNMGNNITNLNDVDVVDIEDGQVLAWDDNDSKFKNVDMIASGGISYSTTETVIGTWINGKPLYQKTFQVTSPNAVNTSVNIISLADYNISEVEYMEGFISVSANTSPSCGGTFILWLRRAYGTDPDRIACQVSNASYLNATMYVTIRYTKTTD